MDLSRFRIGGGFTSALGGSFSAFIFSFSGADAGVILSVEASPLEVGASLPEVEASLLEVGASILEVEASLLEVGAFGFGVETFILEVVVEGLGGIFLALIFSTVEGFSVVL